jgi:hypothetical protein
MHLNINAHIAQALPGKEGQPKGAIDLGSLQSLNWTMCWAGRFFV